MHSSSNLTYAENRNGDGLVRVKKTRDMKGFRVGNLSKSPSRMGRDNCEVCNNSAIIERICPEHLVWSRLFIPDWLFDDGTGTGGEK